MDPFNDLDRNVPMYNSMLHEQQAWQAECEQKLNEDPQSDGAKRPSMANQNPSDAEADLVRAAREEALASGPSKRTVLSYIAALVQFSDLIKP